MPVRAAAVPPSAVFGHPRAQFRGERGVRRPVRGEVGAFTIDAGRQDGHRKLPKAMPRGTITLSTGQTRNRKKLRGSHACRFAEFTSMTRGMARVFDMDDHPGCPGASSAGNGSTRRRLTVAAARLIVPVPDPPGVRQCPPPKTLYDKIWDAHLVHEAPDGTCLLYIDRHLVHEVTSPQAFEGLRMAGRKVRAPEKTVAVPDHNVPTWVGREKGIDDAESRIQVEALKKNAEDFGVEHYGVEDVRQGIVHIIGPEQGWTQPGMTIVCGDSHTATHGAFGALAHGIGTSEVEHVLATQTLIQRKAKNMRVEVRGALGPGVTAKDITLSIIGATGTAGGTGHVIEYTGEAIRAPVDGRPDDGLQHGDRRRRAGRADRARRRHLRLRPRPAEGAEGRGLGDGGGRTGGGSSPTRARISTRRSCSTRPTSRRW